MALSIEEKIRREIRKEWRNSENLNLKNEYGISDPTPKLAVKKIVGQKEKRTEW